MPRRLDDEQALYPPDVERVTPEAREQRNHAIVGTALVALGCGYLLQRIVGHDLDFFFLSIGLGLLVGWARVPRYAMFAFGAIITGFGLQDFFESLVSVRFESTVGSLLVASGFAAVYIRYPRRSWWPIVAAAFFCVGAVLDFGVGIIGLVSASVGLMPIALVSAGTLLLLRDRLPSWFVTAGLIMAGIVFLLAAVTNVGDGSGPRPPAVPSIPAPPSETTSVPVPTTTADGPSASVQGTPS